MKCTKHNNHFIEKTFLLLVRYDFHRFPIQWLVKRQYRIMTIFSSHVGWVDTRIISGWHISDWLKMYYSLTWNRTIIRCFHKTIPQGFHRCSKPRNCHKLPRTFALSRATLQQISLVVWYHKKNCRISFWVLLSTISLISIAVLLIADNNRQ